jgi:hypothetical protein
MKPQYKIKPTDVEMSDKKHVEKKNQTENCIM